MDTALTKLVGKTTPPAAPPGGKVDWGRLEAAVGLAYPASFKEFVAAYGWSVWFDNFSPFYADAKTPAEAKKFVQAVRKRLKWLDGNMYDEAFRPASVPLYPEAGGLFPFAMDYGGNQYLWRTERSDPDRWPVVIWLRGQLVVLERMTVAKMLLGFLERRKPMLDLMGDVRMYEPGRIRINAG